MTFHLVTSSAKTTGFPSWLTNVGKMMSRATTGKKNVTRKSKNPADLKDLTKPSKITYQKIAWRWHHTHIANAKRALASVGEHARRENDETGKSQWALNYQRINRLWRAWRIWVTGKQTEWAREPTYYGCRTRQLSGTLEVVGSIPTGRWALFFSFQPSVVRQLSGPSRKRNTTDFLSQKNWCSAVQPNLT